MPELQQIHIEQISRDIERQNICFSHLAEELLDHLCCDVEEEMVKGLSFPEAYRNVRHKIGKGRLREIQEETLMAVDTKYRNMKNTMKISGVAGTVMMSFAALFRIMHLPGAGILMTLGALVLLSLFLPSSIIVLWKESQSGRRLFMFISGFVMAAGYIMGILFKVQHWPLAGFMISIAVVSGVLFFLPSLLVFRLSNTDNPEKKPAYIIGVFGAVLYLAAFWFRLMHWPLAGLLTFLGSALIFIIALPWYTIVTWKREEHVRARFIFILVAPLLLYLPASLVNINIERSYEEGFDFFLNRQALVGKYLAENNSAFVAKNAGTGDLENIKILRDKTGELLSVIDRLTYGGESLMSGSPGLAELEKSLAAYLDFLKSRRSFDALDVFANLLSTSTYLTEGEILPEEITIVTMPVRLGIIRNGVLVSEAIALQSIITEKQ
jgi:hypothetical protein